MIELINVDRLPIREVVALRTVRAQAALVLIRMAVRARLGDAQESAIQIRLDPHTLKRRDFQRGVALVAAQARVPPFERITGLLVIEDLDVPLDQREVLAVMFRMAADAFLA